MLHIPHLNILKSRSSETLLSIFFIKYLLGKINLVQLWIKYFVFNFGLKTRRGKGLVLLLACHMKF